MFQLYLRLRLKNFGRIIPQLGLFRSIFLLLLAGIAVAALFLAENRLAIPVASILLVGSYHNYRKDKALLRNLTKHFPVFLMKEYSLIILPFASMELAKGRLIDALFLETFSLSLPFIKEIKLKQNPIRLPLLYKGGYEYIRMFRQAIWLYALFLLAAIAGAMHGNLRIDKVCFILWGLIQAAAYMQRMDKSYLLHFKDFRTLCRFQLKSMAWNISLTSAPFGITLILFGRDWKEAIFVLSFYAATMVYAMGVSMLRHIIHADALTFMVQFTLLIPFYLGTLFVPYLLLPGTMITLSLIYLAHKNLKTLL